MYQVQYTLSVGSTPCERLRAANSLQTGGNGQPELEKYVIPFI